MVKLCLLIFAHNTIQQLNSTPRTHRAEQRTTTGNGQHDLATRETDALDSMTVTESETLNSLLGDLVAAKARDAPETELQALITSCSLTLLSYKVRHSTPYPPSTHDHSMQ